MFEFQTNLFFLFAYHSTRLTTDFEFSSKFKAMNLCIYMLQRQEIAWDSIFEQKKAIGKSNRKKCTYYLFYKNISFTNTYRANV